MSMSRQHEELTSGTPRATLRSSWSGSTSMSPAPSTANSSWVALTIRRRASSRFPADSAGPRAPAGPGGPRWRTSASRPPPDFRRRSAPSISLLRPGAAATARHSAPAAPSGLPSVPALPLGRCYYGQVRGQPCRGGSRRVGCRPKAARTSGLRSASRPGTLSGNVHRVTAQARRRTRGSREGSGRGCRGRMTSGPTQITGPDRLFQQVDPEGVLDRHGDPTSGATWTAIGCSRATHRGVDQRPGRG